MQCRGKTRIGKRCRNRSVDGELFCDVHMRVNHSYNLSLLIPLLSGLLLCYFFFFGLFFNTVVFGVFDINYLKFAGIEDLFLNMLRFGGMIGLILIFLWCIYVIVVSVIFCVLLVIQMIRSTRKSELSFVERLKIIGLSLTIFTFNIAQLFVVLFPARNKALPKAVNTKRENFSKSLFNLKSKSGKSRAGKPILTARETFQDYLYFRSAGNHRFFMTILLLFGISIGITYHAGSQAERARDCNLIQSENRTNGVAGLPTGSLIVNHPCNAQGGFERTGEQSLSRTFISALTGFFNFTPVELQTASGKIPLLHLASTSRFDLFFNLESANSIVVPRNSTNNQADLKSKEDRLEQKLNLLNSKITDNAKKRYLLQLALKRTDETVAKMSTRDLKRRKSEDAPRNDIFSSACWDQSPSHIISFNSSSRRITDASSIELISKIAKKYRDKAGKGLIIAGYADPSGPESYNLNISNARAQQVRKMFENLGIPSHRIIAFGMGENDSLIRPMRRIEIKICSRS
ncbi:MAG: OmpA family protein [Sneathiella sp.]